MSISGELRQLLKTSPDETIQWAMRWNNITGKVIPKGKREKALKDLRLLNMGYSIRHGKEKKGKNN